MEKILNPIAESTLEIPFVTGALFVIVALITLLFPPKKINYLYGYRTIASMKNQQTWDFAQRYSGLKMIQIGFILIAFSLLNIFMQLNEGLQLAFGFTSIILVLAYFFLTTEKAIRNNFPNN